MKKKIIEFVGEMNIESGDYSNDNIEFRSWKLGTHKKNLEIIGLKIQMIADRLPKWK